MISFSRATDFWCSVACIPTLCIYLFCVFHINGVKKYVTYCAWPVSTAHNILRFIHIIACINTPFLLWLSNVLWCTTVCLAIHPLMNSWAIFICIDHILWVVLLWTTWICIGLSAFYSFSYIYMSEIFNFSYFMFLKLCVFVCVDFHIWGYMCLFKYICICVFVCIWGPRDHS